MLGRRRFLTGLMAAGAIPTRTWADAGSPTHLAAAARRDTGGYILCGLNAAREITFQIPLPGRGHAATGHPSRPEAVAFARRPGRFALVIDCSTGETTASMDAPEGRHFYGHGCFSQDGALLFTTENDYNVGAGRIGIWDGRSYQRIGEITSGGIGPHDIRRLPGSDVLVVANGGIDTHPDSGRTKLNIPTMRPNLSYIQDGAITDSIRLAPEWHKNSIRHLAISGGGLVACAMQWEGDRHPGFLIGLHRIGEDSIRPLSPGPDRLRHMHGYIGSVAFSEDDSQVLATSPRGGQVQIFDVATGALQAELDIADACGVAAAPGGALISAGDGTLRPASAPEKAHQTSGLMWDNHLVQL